MARGSPFASLLVPVAMLEQGLSSKLLAFEKQLEDHEVAVLELERQVAVLELGEKFKQLLDLVNEAEALECERQVAVEQLEVHFQRLSDRVNETKVLEGERQLAVVELEGNFKRLSERVNEHISEFKGTSLAVAELGVELKMRGRDFGELTSFVVEDIQVAGRLHEDLKVKVLSSLRPSTMWRVVLTILNSGVKSSLRACEVQPPGQGGIQILATVWSPCEHAA